MTATIKLEIIAGDDPELAQAVIRRLACVRAVGVSARAVIRAEYPQVTVVYPPGENEKSDSESESLDMDELRPFL